MSAISPDENIYTDELSPPIMLSKLIRGGKTRTRLYKPHLLLKAVMAGLYTSFGTLLAISSGGGYAADFRASHPSVPKVNTVPAQHQSDLVWHHVQFGSAADHLYRC